MAWPPFDCIFFWFCFFLLRILFFYLYQQPPLRVLRRYLFMHGLFWDIPYFPIFVFIFGFSSLFGSLWASTPYIPCGWVDDGTGRRGHAQWHVASFHLLWTGRGLHLFGTGWLGLSPWLGVRPAGLVWVVSVWVCGLVWFWPGLVLAGLVWFGLRLFSVG